MVDCLGIEWPPMGHAIAETAPNATSASVKAAVFIESLLWLTERIVSWNCIQSSKTTRIATSFPIQADAHRFGTTMENGPLELLVVLIGSDRATMQPVTVSKNC